MQTVGASMMAITLDSLAATNHKFDPVSIKDYYSMTGVFRISNGGRRPNCESHPKQKAADRCGQNIKHRAALQCQKLGRRLGAYRVALQSSSGQVPTCHLSLKAGELDELEVFGTEERQKNLALAKHGTEVKSRFTCERISGRPNATLMMASTVPWSGGGYEGRR